MKKIILFLLLALLTQIITAQTQSCFEGVLEAAKTDYYNKNYFLALQKLNAIENACVNLETISKAQKIVLDQWRDSIANALENQKKKTEALLLEVEIQKKIADNAVKATDSLVNLLNLTIENYYLLTKELLKEKEQRDTALISNLLPLIYQKENIFNNIIDLMKFMSSDNLLIEDELKLLVRIPQFPMNEGQFFYIEYTYNNERIPKKLSYIGDTLSISKIDLLKVDGKPIDPKSVSNYKFYYRNSITKMSTEICNLYPVFVEKKE